MATNVFTLPMAFARRVTRVETTDPRLGAIIEIQEILSQFSSDEEVSFVLETAVKNMDFASQLAQDIDYKFEE